MGTYYVDPLTGDDLNSGGSGSRWATLQKALDTIVAGDEVRVCNSAEETTAVQIDADTNAGTNTNRIYVIGCDASGEPLTSGVYSVRATAAMSSVLRCNTGCGHIEFQRVRFDADGNATNCVNHAVDLNGIRLLDCELLDATSHGAVYRGAASSLVDQHLFERVTISGCGGIGANRGASNRGTANFYGCRINGNAQGGIYHDRATIIQGNLIYGNGLIGLQIGSSADGSTIESNTIDGSGTTGLHFDGGSINSIVASNAITNSGGVAIYENNGAAGTIVNYFFYNSLHGNAGGTFGNAGGDTSMPAISARNRGNVYTDPKYANRAGGDFSPLVGSSLLHASRFGQTIGAIHPAPGGGATYKRIRPVRRVA